MNFSKLQEYLPQNALPHVERWLKPYRVVIKITNSRSSKLGDYRPLPDGGHQISINHDLPPQLFLMVLTHEIAHLHTYIVHKRGVPPHGYEWKNDYQRLLIESFDLYQEDFKPLLQEFIRSPKANYMATPEIVRYFSPDQQKEVVGDLTPGNLFRYQNRRFEIIEKRKKHYLCKDLASGKKYVFNALAEVKRIVNEA